MADTKITALAAIATVDPAADVLPIVDISDTSMAASGTTKKVTTNQILQAGGTATLASATISGDLTVATDRLKVVTGSTAVQIGATTQTQVGTTAWPSTVLGKSNARFLVGNEGIVINWNESAPVIGNYSSIFAGAKTGIGATTIGGLQIRAGIENASNQDGFCSFWTSNQAAGGYVKRYEIDSTGISTWSVAGTTAMTLNSTGLGVGTVPANVITARAAQDTGLELNSAASNASRLIFAYDPANTRWYINSTLSGSGTTLPLAFLIGNTERMRIDTSGNVGIGVTPAGTGGCLQLKSGVTFPATQVASADANTLDDYEEGTWTPTVTSEFGTIGTTTVISANYTKIGRVVSVNFDVRVDTLGTGSGGLVVSLPFSGAGAETCGVGREIINTGNMCQVMRQSSTTASVRFYNYLTVIANTNRVVCAYTYFV